MKHLKKLNIKDCTIDLIVVEHGEYEFVGVALWDDREIAFSENEDLEYCFESLIEQIEIELNQCEQFAEAFFK